MENPSRITEGAVTYSLGTFDGKKVEYDFQKVLVYLNAKGKLLFGSDFHIYEEDKAIVLQLCNYMVRDFANCRRTGSTRTRVSCYRGPSAVARPA